MSALLLFPPGGQAQENAVFEKGIDQAYAKYALAQSTRHDGERAQNACQVNPTVKHYADAEATAREGLTISRQIQASGPGEADRLRYLDLLLNSELGYAMKRYNDIAKARPAAGLKVHYGSPGVFGAMLDDLDQLGQSGNSLGPGQTVLFDYFRGIALVGIGRKGDGVVVLNRFRQAHASSTDLQGYVDDAGYWINNKPPAPASSAANSNATPAAGDKDALPKALNGVSNAPLRIDDPFKGGECAVPPAFATDYSLGLSTGVGYEDNVAMLGRSAPLPANVPRKGAFFNESVLTAGVIRYFNIRPADATETDGDLLVDTFVLGYLADAVEYDDLGFRNSLIQSATVDYFHSLATDFGGGLSGGDSWLRANNRNVSNVVSARPYLKKRWADPITTTLAYTASYTKDFLRDPPRNDADGFTHVAQLQLDWVVLRGRKNHLTPASFAVGPDWTGQLTLSPSYQHQWVMPDGPFRRFQRDDPLAKAELILLRSEGADQFVRSVAVAALYEYRRDHYERLLPPTLAARAVHRNDNIHLFGVSLVVKMWYSEDKPGNRLEGTLDYRVTKQDSNVQARAYDDSRLLASLKLNL